MLRKSPPRDALENRYQPKAACGRLEEMLISRARDASPAKIEALDMVRRGLQDEDGKLVMERKTRMDEPTSRRLFTLSAPCIGRDESFTSLGAALNLPKIVVEKTRRTTRPGMTSRVHFDRDAWT